MDEASVEDLHNALKSLKGEYQEIKQKIDELEEEERKLKKELGTVKTHRSYYESLVSDMKKKMQGRKSIDFLDQL
ncbi:MAG: hypothetical protein ACOC53_00580 [Candidatus Saliniplasma sp.]